MLIGIPDTGYIDCIGIFDNETQAYGKAYSYLVHDVKYNDRFSVSIPELCEGEHGCIIWTACKDKPDLIRTTATILEYEEADR